MQPAPRELHGQGIWNVWLWVAAGLVFAALNLSNPSEPRSRLWFSELVLYGLMAFGVWANTKFDLRKRVRLPRRFAPAAYYTLAYSSFIALPLLFIDEELLWREPAQSQRHSIPYFWLLGFVLALAIRMFWGLVYGPLVTSLLHLPPQ